LNDFFTKENMSATASQVEKSRSEMLYVPFEIGHRKAKQLEKD